MTESAIKYTITAAFALIFGTTAGTGCSPKSKEIDCEDTSSGKKAVTGEAKTEATGPDRDESDWCHACVLGPKGYTSCQRVYAVDERESRDSLRKRSADRACKDAGFKEGECPASSIISMVCKGANLPKAMPKDDGIAKAFRQIIEKANPQDKAAPDSGSEPTAVEKKVR